MATTKSKKEEPKEKAEATKQKTKPVMYVGPTMAKYALIQNTIYSELPESAKELFEKSAITKMLLIDVEKYPEAEKSIRERTGIYWQAFNEIRK